MILYLCICIHVLRSILSSVGGWERYSSYYLHMEVCAPQVCNFKLLQCFGSIEVNVYLSAHVWRAMGTGVRYTVKKAFRYSYPKPWMSLTNLSLGGNKFCLTSLFPPGRVWQAASRPGRGQGYRKAFFTVYSLTNPSPVFFRLIQDGGFACLPASQSQPRKCRLFPSLRVT